MVPGLAHPVVAPLARHRHRRLRPRPRLRPRRGEAEAGRAACRPRTRLSHLLSELSLLRAEVGSGAARVPATRREEPGRERLTTMAAALRFNNLKIAASEQAPRVCQGALGVCGIVGYKNDTPFSVGRHLRDTMSACLMVANERIHADERRPAADRQGGLAAWPIPPGRRRPGGVPGRAASTAGCWSRPACPASTGAAARFEDVRQRFDALVARRPRADAPEVAALPAGAAAPAARAQRLPEVVPAPRRAAIFAFEGDEAQAAEQDGARDAGTRTGASSSRMTDLVLTPAACYPVYPAVAAPRPAAARRRDRRRGRRVRVPARAVGRPGAAADVPPARARADRRAGDGRGVARRLARPGARAPARARARRRLRRRHRPVLRPRRPDARGQPARAGAQVRDPGPDRRARADGGRVVQLPPGPLRRRVYGITLGRRRRRPHGVPRLRPRAHRRSRCCAPTGSIPRRWPRTSARGSGPRHERHGDGHGQPASGSIPRPTGRTRSTPARAHLLRDQLLHRRPHRARCTRAATSRWPAMGFTLRMDFEGDQWTFFKPPPEDLELLFGIDIHEMQPYRPLPRPDRRAARRRAAR